jgi:hypothetical protein
MLLAFGVLVSPSGVLAADPPEVSASREPRDCFRGQPLPECANFVVSEVSYGGRADAYDPRSENNHLSLEMGLMYNRGPRTALGASVSHIWSEDSRLGVHFRYRRWLNNVFSLDLSPGLRLSGRDMSTYSFDYPGVTARVGLMYADAIGMSVEMDAGKTVLEGNQVDWRVNITTGSYASGVVAVAGLVLIGAYAIALSDPNY